MKYEHTSMNRRNFLGALGLLAGGAAAAHVLPVQAASSRHKENESRLSMGTVVGITALAASSGQARDAIGLAFEEMDRHIAVFNRFDPATALSVFNDQGKLKGAPDELADVLQRSLDLGRISSGAFNVTVAPLVDLMERSKGRPDRVSLNEALNLADAGQLHIQGNDLSLGRTGMAVTLDGIAKGFIADQAAKTLRTQGVDNFLINAGGDILASGSPNERRPWRVAIEDPNKQYNYPDTLDISYGALATSGGYEIFYDAEKRSHHLVNPETGASPRLIRSVSVQAPTVMEADALATALSILPPRQALDLVARLPRRECLLITDTGAKLTSRGWGRPTV